MIPNIYYRYRNYPDTKWLKCFGHSNMKSVVDTLKYTVKKGVSRIEHRIEHEGYCVILDANLEIICDVVDTSLVSLLNIELFSGIGPKTEQIEKVEIPDWLEM